MKITFVGHSCFLVETKKVNLLFDYASGSLPELDKDKPLIVFASHVHGDHFHIDIFKWNASFKNVKYVLSEDVVKDCQKKEITMPKHWISVHNYMQKVVPLHQDFGDREHLLVETIPSTDEGVAFLVSIDGFKIYHAGDLNWWVWDGESKQEFNNMTALFKRYMEKLCDASIDLAFVPLDPRQEKYYALGMNYLLDTAKVNYVVPMHCWGKYEIMQQYEEEFPAQVEKHKLLKFTKENEYMDIENVSL